MRPVQLYRFYSATSNFSNKFRDQLIKKFAPLNNRNHYEHLITQNPKISKFNRASILIPISTNENDNKKTYFTFMQRTLNSRHYSGQICFMGGMSDSADRDEIETAMREMHEESGIDSSRFTFLAKLCPVVVTNIGRDSFLLTPVVVHFDKSSDLKLNLNKSEVEKLVDVETEIFLSNQNYEMNAIEIADDDFYLHYFERLPVLGDNDVVTVWGITALWAVIISSFLNSRLPEFPLDPHIRQLDHNDPNKFISEFVLKKSAKIIDLFLER